VGSIWRRRAVVVKKTISLSDEVAAGIDRLRPHINVSAICEDALRAHLERSKKPIGVKHLKDPR
jgi:hypothetical protein